MDGRILALGIALIVTAIGLSTAIVMLPPVDTPSDYSLLDEVAGGRHLGLLRKPWDKPEDGDCKFPFPFCVNLRDLISPVIFH